jgi:hypothetical protein
MNRELELTALSVAVTAFFGLLFSSLGVNPGQAGATIPEWDMTDITVSTPVLGDYDRDFKDVHLTKPILWRPDSAMGTSPVEVPDCGTAGRNGRLTITPPVLQEAETRLDLGEVGLVQPQIEMPELRRPLPALMDLQRYSRMPRIA